MYTYLYRLNAVLTFAITGLAVICIAASMSDLLHSSTPSVDLQVVKYDGLRRLPGENDQARFTLNISADLSSLFSWNTKQLFVFVAVEYTTPKNSLNQISVWDRIITSKDDAKFNDFSYNKYALIDQGSNLRNREFNLTMYWNVMPKTGRMFIGQQVVSGFQFPKDYFTSR